MQITIYGPGCAKCKLAEDIVRKTVAESDVVIDVEKVSDIRAMVEAGVLSTPAVAVDGIIKLSGRIPKPDEIMKWING